MLLQVPACFNVAGSAASRHWGCYLRHSEFVVFILWTIVLEAGINRHRNQSGALLVGRTSLATAFDGTPTP